MRALQITLTRSPRGAHTAAFVGPNSATVAVPVAAAKCVMPESFPMNTAALASHCANSRRSGITTAPAKSSSGPQHHRTGILGFNSASNSSHLSMGQFFFALPENGCNTAKLSFTTGCNKIRGEAPVGAFTCVR